MAFDLAYLEQRVIDRTSLSSTDTRLTQAVRYRAINDALEQISLEHFWPWLLSSETIATVAGTATRALPTGYIATNSIVNTTLRDALRPSSLIDIDLLTSTGIPVLYHSAAVITWGPTPAAVYSLSHRYYRVEPALATSGAVPLIPQAFGRGVIEYAALLLLQQVREADMAATAEKNYNEWLKRAQDNARATREPARVRLRMGSWF